MKTTWHNPPVAAPELSPTERPNPAGKFLLVSLLTLVGAALSFVLLLARLQTYSGVNEVFVPMLLLFGFGVCAYIFIRAWWHLSHD